MGIKNGLYLTSRDFDSFNNQIDNIYYEEGDVDYEKNRSQNITFIVTESCNLRCTYCYQTNKTDRKMTKKIAKEAIDFIFDSKKINDYFDLENSKAVILDFIGGEPLLEIELMDYICEYFKYKANEVGHIWKDNYKISISTNGTLYFDPKVQSFLKRNKNNISLGVSLDGNKELHDKCRLFPDGSGSYDLASKASKAHLKFSQNAGTKLTLSPDNITYLFEAVKSLYEDIGLTCIHANCVFEEGWNDFHAQILYSEMVKLADYIIDNELYDKMYCSLFEESIGKPLDEEQKDKNWCGGNGKMLTIGIDGTCYPCARYAPSSMSNGRKPMIIGNIYDGLQTKDKEKGICKHLKSITLKTESTDKCLNCKIASGCALCNAYNYDKFGDPNIRATFICIMHEARVKANEYYWKKLYDKLNIEGGEFFEDYDR